MKPISAFNEWSCGLACLESLAIEQGQAFDQAGFIQQYRQNFPLWADKPGVVSLKIDLVGQLWMIRWDFYDMARQLGWVNRLKMLRDKEAVKLSLSSPGHSVFAVTRRSQESGAWIELSHQVRILQSNDRGLLIMNPGKHEAGRLEDLSWDEFMHWEPFVFALHKKEGASEEAPSVEPGEFQA